MFRGDCEIYGGVERFDAVNCILAQSAVQPRAATEWLEVFAESQVPHAKIMGCAKFDAVRAASH